MKTFFGFMNVMFNAAMCLVYLQLLIHADAFVNGNTDVGPNTIVISIMAVLASMSTLIFYDHYIDTFWDYTNKFVLFLLLIVGAIGAPITIINELVSYLIDGYRIGAEINDREGNNIKKVVRVKQLPKRDDPIDMDGESYRCVASFIGVDSSSYIIVRALTTEELKYK